MTPDYLPGNLRLVISVRIPDARLLNCITIVPGPTPEAVLRHGLKSLPRFLLSSARGRPREPCFGTARSRIYICIFVQHTGYAYAVCNRPGHSSFHLRRDRGGICTARPASTSRPPATLPTIQYRRALRGRPACTDGAPRRTPCAHPRSSSGELARTSTLVHSGTPAFAADLPAAS